MRSWLLSLLIISSNCFAGIGSVTEQINAPPSIQRKNSTITGSKGTEVEMLDAVRTQSGKAQITFEDQTKVQVNENSKLVIDDFVYDPKSKAGKLGVKVALGTVRYASGQIAKNSPQNVAVNTPSATISVRGTDFTATVDELFSGEKAELAHKEDLESESEVGGDLSPKISDLMILGRSDCSASP